MSNAIWVAVVWIVLHTVDGQEIYVNPDEVAVMRPTSEAAKGTPNQIMVTGVHCVVGLTNGKYFSVIETCPAVQEIIEKATTIDKE